MVELQLVMDTVNYYRQMYIFSIPMSIRILVYNYQGGFNTCDSIYNKSHPNESVKSVILVIGLTNLSDSPIHVFQKYLRYVFCTNALYWASSFKYSTKHYQ